MALIDENTTRRRVTLTQLEAMWEFLQAHKELATGYNISAQAREHSKRLWDAIANALNAQGEGAIKNGKGWSSYWVDYKAKLKKRAAMVRASQNRTGGGPSSVLPLNEIELKYIGLLGGDFGAGLPNIQVDPFPTLPQSSNQEQPQALPSTTPPIPFLTSPVPSLTLIFTPQSPTLPYLAPPSPSLLQEVSQTSQPPVRWRRNRIPQMTPEEARRSLVEISRERLEIEKANHNILKQMLNAINKMADNISRLVYYFIV